MSTISPMAGPKLAHLELCSTKGGPSSDLGEIPCLWLRCWRRRRFRSPHLAASEFGQEPVWEVPTRFEMLIQTFARKRASKARIWASLPAPMLAAKPIWEPRLFSASDFGREAGLGGPGPIPWIGPGLPTSASRSKWDPKNGASPLRAPFPGKFLAEQTSGRPWTIYMVGNVDHVDRPWPARS